MTNSDKSSEAITPKKTLGKRAAKKLWKLLTINPNTTNVTNSSFFEAGTKSCRDMTMQESYLNDKDSTVSNISTKYSSTNSTVDTNSQKSTTCTLNEAAKLFPRNMPSIRRSRRRLKQQGCNTPQHSRESSANKGVLNTSHKSAFARVATTQNVQETSAATTATVEMLENTKKSCIKIKMTPKKVKANCSKNRLKSKALATTATTSTTTTTTLRRSISKTSQQQVLYAKKALVTSTAAATATVKPSTPGKTKTATSSSNSSTSLNSIVQHKHSRDLSQQSSLISYDLSCATSQQSLQQTVNSSKDNVNKYPVGQNMSDDTFLSSGISCPSETHSEASATNSPTFYQTSITCQTIGKAFQYRNVSGSNSKNYKRTDDANTNQSVSNFKINVHVLDNKSHKNNNNNDDQIVKHTTTNNNNNAAQEDEEEDLLISLELAMITGGCDNPQTFNSYQKKTITTSSTEKSNDPLDVMDLHNLNKCRNRNAVWMHATSFRDDHQLSDIEEQLYKIEMTATTTLTSATMTNTTTSSSLLTKQNVKSNFDIQHEIDHKNAAAKQTRILTK